MQLSTQTDVKNYFKLLDEAGFDIPGVYSPADKVIDAKIVKIIRAGNTKNLDIEVEKIVQTLDLRKIDSFNEITLVVKKYFDSFSDADKLNQMYDKLRFVFTQIDGEKLIAEEQKSMRKSEHGRGYLINFESSLKISLGSLTHFSHNDIYTCYNCYDNIQALSYLVKYFFDAVLPIETTFKGSNISKWVECTNGLSMRVFKNGTLEVKHKDLDILAKEIIHYYNSKYKHYYFKIS